MKTNWNLHLAHYRRGLYEYGQIARRAAELEKTGIAVGDVLVKIGQEFPITIAPAKRPMKDTPGVYGKWEPAGMPFEAGAIEQMDNIARLPVFAGGALMPDAHQGYVMPIGGVAALENALMPSAIGVDIACRVTATFYQINDADVPHAIDIIKGIGRFGFDTNEGSNSQYHPVMDDSIWTTNKLFAGLKDKAIAQLGTSGSGNHFINLMRIGSVFTGNGQHAWSPDGLYVLLSHSGSRGTGAKVGDYYMALADEVCETDVPKGHGYFTTRQPEFVEYNAALRVMGKYAQACHHLIHARFNVAAGDMVTHLSPRIIGAEATVETGVNAQVDGVGGVPFLSILENHHNFAWYDVIGGKTVWIHRKGATPAGAGKYGLIPGSSGSASYVVRGKGNKASFDSASHGAGRPRSRTATKALHDEAKFRAHMQDYGTQYFGVAPDETVFAYKNIEVVMAAQTDLVEKVAAMHPVFTMMGGLKSDDGD